MGKLSSTAEAMRRLAAGGLAVLTAAVLTGCLADSPTGGSDGGSVPVSVSVNVPGSISSPQSPPAAASIRVTDGTNEVVMESVELVLRDLRLAPDDASSCTAGECVVYVGEAALLPVPSDGGVLRLDTRSVPVDRYDRLDVTLHAPTADEPVVDEEPEMEGVSVRVEGTYNDEPFTFTTDLTSDLRLSLDPALVFEQDQVGTANVTMLISVKSWFRAEGVGLVDPRTAGAGGENEALVEANIGSSFQAFRDDDRDGEPGSPGR